MSSICTHGTNHNGRICGLVTCFPDTDLTTVVQLMEAKNVKHLPIVERGGNLSMEGKRKLLGIIYYDSISYCLRSVMFFFSVHRITIPVPNGFFFSEISSEWHL